MLTPITITPADLFALMTVAGLWGAVMGAAAFHIKRCQP